MSTLRVYHQGASAVVIGTSTIAKAAQHLPPTVTSWEGSTAGLFARRKNGWTRVSDDRAPKDARPGVQFTALRDSSGRAVTARTVGP